MFLGTLPIRALKVVQEIVKKWNCPHIYVGCCGNFTIERTIHEQIEGVLISNDVTSYSCALGYFFAGRELPISWKEGYVGEWQWLEEFVVGRPSIGVIATMILLTDVGKFKEGKNSYSDRMRAAYQIQFPELHRQMVEKLSVIKLELEDFYAEDVMNFMDRVEPEDGFISFPPFFKGGYEKMWSVLKEVFDFHAPEYELFDPETSLPLFVEKLQRMSHFCVAMEREIPELEEYFHGTVKTSNGKDIYFYTKTEGAIFVRDKGLTTEHILTIPRIGMEDDIDDVEIRKLSMADFNELRSAYLAKGISPAMAREALGVYTKVKLFGVFAFSVSPTTATSFDSKIDFPTIFLMTDFSVSPVRVRHLSKLVLYTVMSSEVRYLAEQKLHKRVRSIVTGVFSNNPISMKYRGLFELLDRKEYEDKLTGRKRYHLTYGTRAGQWTLKEGFGLWKQKYLK